MQEVRDVVIIGSGAGGAPLALRLSQAGFDVLVLEKGPRYGRADYRHDEVFMTTRPGFFVPPVDQEPHVVVDSTGDAPRREASTLGWIACCVGGGTAHMGGALFRFHPDDFRLRSRFGEFEAVADWPYAYNDLEPYYCRAEWEIGISGSAGANPFEGPRSRAYPMPPLPSHPLARTLEQTCQRLGLHAFPTPRAINSRPYGGRPACSHCDFCAGYGCPTGARGSTAEALLPRAERTGNCTVRPGAMAHEVTIGPDGRATGCIYVDATGARHRVLAETVCICCSAVESARLLLLSTSLRFPGGLANGTGLVGRNLQFHAGSSGSARFRYDDGRGLPLRDRHGHQLRSLMDHYFLPAGVSDLPKGGIHRFGITRTHPLARAQKLALSDPDGPLWGDRLQRRLREHFRDARAVDFEVFQDFIPNERTFVTLDPEVKDKWGLPVARIHIGPCEHHRRAGQWLMSRGLEVLDAMGAEDVLPGSAGYTNGAMTHGTCRAGSDPRTAVLNEFCRAHEVPNLFVVDGSFMPTSGGAPSTLTIIANSFRTADHIIDRARSRDFG